MEIQSDLHIHTTLSSCCADPAQTPENILSLLSGRGFRKIAFTDHLWENPAVPVTGSTFRFVIPDRSALKGTFTPADSFAGVAVWDTSNMIAATFEPFYNPLMIPPGGSVSFEAGFQAE